MHIFYHNDLDNPYGKRLYDGVYESTNKILDKVYLKVHNCIYETL